MHPAEFGEGKQWENALMKAQGFISEALGKKYEYCNADPNSNWKPYRFFTDREAARAAGMTDDPFDIRTQTFKTQLAKTLMNERPYEIDNEGYLVKGPGPETIFLK